MTTQARPYIGSIFWIKWVSANMIAVTISVSVFYVGGMILFGGVFGGGSLLLIILGIPAVVGKSQSLILDKYVDWFGWTGITIGGWVLGCLIVIFIGADALFSAWAGVLLGLTVGVAQWSIMNRYIHRHMWWIATNIVAIFLGVEISNIIASTFYKSAARATPILDFWGYLLNEGTLASIIAASIVFSVITGTALTWILAHQNNN